MFSLHTPDPCPSIKNLINIKKKENILSRFTILILTMNFIIDVIGHRRELIKKQDEKYNSLLFLRVIRDQMHQIRYA